VVDIIQPRSSLPPIGEGLYLLMRYNFGYSMANLEAGDKLEDSTTVLRVTFLKCDFWIISEFLSVIEISRREEFGCLKKEILKRVDCTW
jgi:hypothetical protein